MNRNYVIFTQEGLTIQMENSGDALLYKRRTKTQFGSLIICGIGYLTVTSQHGPMSPTMQTVLKSI
jgi:hypothetical protein